MVVGVLIFNYFKAGQVGEIALEEPGNSQTEAGQEDKQNRPDTYEVQTGESLWKISEKLYGTGYNWTDIASANNLSNPDYVEAGTKLTIPNIETEEQEQVEQIATNAPQINQEDSETTPDTYTVKQGDHLWKIAQEVYNNGYKWTEIAQANNIQNPDLIEVGQQLKLPGR
ncbi:MAG: LysM peptidoglycan-binding domain-containing protein [Candidatus Pacebacteria bacterium]|nr:LysM peptidoglycan-binding domain-containing protein [Candidatus Paceibacterota bacterium]